MLYCVSSGIHVASMRICLSIQSENVHEMRLSEHFGAVGRFVIFDTDRQSFTPHACHAALCKGPCHCHLPALQQGDFDAVICLGIGAGAFAAMRRSRINVYLTRTKTVRDALSEWQSKRLALAHKGICRPEFLGSDAENRRRRQHGAPT